VKLTFALALIATLTSSVFSVALPPHANFIRGGNNGLDLLWDATKLTFDNVGQLDDFLGNISSLSKLNVSKDYVVTPVPMIDAGSVSIELADGYKLKIEAAAVAGTPTKVTLKISCEAFATLPTISHNLGNLLSLITHAGTDLTVSSPIVGGIYKVSATAGVSGKIKDAIQAEGFYSEKIAAAAAATANPVVLANTVVPGPAGAAPTVTTKPADNDKAYCYKTGVTMFCVRRVTASGDLFVTVMPVHPMSFAMRTLHGIVLPFLGTLAVVIVSVGVVSRVHGYADPSGYQAGYEASGIRGVSLLSWMFPDFGDEAGTEFIESEDGSVQYDPSSRKRVRVNREGKMVPIGEDGSESVDHAVTGNALAFGASVATTFVVAVSLLL